MIPGWASRSDTAGAPQQPDRLGEGEAPTVDVGWGASAQEALESVLDRRDVPALAHGLADVGAPDGAAVGDPCQRLGLDRVAQLRQPLEDVRVAHVTVTAQLGQRGAQLPGGQLAEEIAQKIEGAVLPLEAQLDAGDDLDAEALAGGERLLDAVDESWSVTATALRPRSRASSTSSAGETVPSE